MDSYQGTGAKSLRPEINLQATRISPGLAKGIAWIMGDILDSNLEASRIESDQVDAEMERIRAAFARVENELEQSARRISEQLDPKLGEIFRAHQLMLQSVLSSNEFENELRESLTTATTVVRSVFRKWEAKFAAIENEILRQNAALSLKRSAF